ncbi:SPASM domain-containing protein, partial [bacterium]|nr:SPASM domain-containing protein [candidate division CSSED10-310 bacterium]
SLRQKKRDGVKILVSDIFLDASREYLKSGSFAWNCDAGLRYFTIFSDGSLAPCSDSESIGNILDMTASSFRDKHYREMAIEKQRSCKGCIYSCWREASYLFSQPAVWHERLLSVLFKRCRN